MAWFLGYIIFVCVLTKYKGRYHNFQNEVCNSYMSQKLIQQFVSVSA